MKEAIKQAGLDQICYFNAMVAQMIPDISKTFPRLDQQSGISMTKRMLTLLIFIS
jgi:hypothetical protein